MKNQNNNEAILGTIVAFRQKPIKSFNRSYLIFEGEAKIDNFVKKLFVSYENQSNFSKRYGYHSTSDDQISIEQLIAEEDFWELEEKFGITEKMLGDKVYTDSDGNNVGLTVEECESGIGRIKGEDTIYTCYLKDCSDAEMESIQNSDYFQRQEFLEALGIEKELEEE